MSRPKKARSGQRLIEAIAQIARFEAEQTDWGSAELATALGISSQQVRNLLATLTMRGLLTFSPRVVRQNGLVLTDAAKLSTASEVAP